MIVAYPCCLPLLRVAGSFHSPFRRVCLCLFGAMAKLDMRVCGDVCGEECGDDCMRVVV